ncbi:MAG TPA: DNRLRE domain-containing protein [Polyangiaceae bacterium]|jgi:hypothetical protein
MSRASDCVIGSILAGISGFSWGCSGAHNAPEQARATTEMQVARPAARLILSDAMVQRLQARAAAGEAAWTALKARCDGYATGTMNPPNGDAYPDFPNVGQGYQGEDYLPAIRALGLCYRTAPQASYGAAGARLLDAMSTPVSAGGQSPSTDSGYGIRNYVVGMAFGFDWLYPALPDATKSHVVSSINTWIDWYDQSGFINNDPIGNYFAGYFLAKTAAALATDGDNPNASTYWNDVVTRMWGQLVKPQFTGKMAGGGWPEGWEYGKRSVQNFAEALWATQTATGLTWWQDIPIAKDQAEYQMHFAWPSLKHLDDQGTIHSGSPVVPSAELMLELAAMQEAAGDPTAAASRGFAADVMSAAGDDSAPWSKFLYGDPAMPKASYKSDALSHFAAGPGHVGVRASWDASAAWGAFSAGAYINASSSGEELFDTGSLSVVAGDQPVLINPTGWLPQNAGTAGEDFVYDDSYGKKQRRLYNTFFVDDASNPYNPGQNSASPADSRAHVERFEDGGGFVHARGVNLEDQYGSGGNHPVSQFTRDLVYVRPGTFVLFDRTSVALASADQWLSFHTPVAPTQATPADSSQRRFDVVVGAAQVGSIRTLLPLSASVTTVSLLGSAARLEVHAPVRGATQQWLSVVTAGAVTGEQVRISAADGNMASSNMVGVELTAPQGQVVLFSADQAAATSVTSADYTVTQASASHVLVDVEPSSAGYAVTATPAAGKMRIQVSPGGAYQASANKTLSFAVSATGSVSAPASSSAPPPATTPPPPTTPPPATPPPPPPATPQTVTLTQGVNGYGGVTDVSISNLYYSPSSNPTGTVYKTNDTLYTYTLDYTTKALVRFDVSQIPATASVTSASLALTIESWATPQLLVGSYLKTPWNYGAATFGWTSTGLGTTWSSPGIGSGDVQGPGFQFLDIDASGYQRKSVALDTASVQAWVNDAANNQGVLLSNLDTGKVLRLYSCEAANPAERPTLSVSYR